jgi:quercetin dioxygenase-like cupin family protein
MRLLAAAVIAACVTTGPALAAPLASALTGPSAAAPPEQASCPVRVAMRKEVLAPGGKLSEDRPGGERYLYVVAGRLKVSDLVTGDEQVVEAGKMTAEEAGDWHVAQALGAEPAVFYIIDRTPAQAAAQSAASGAGGGN